MGIPVEERGVTGKRRDGDCFRMGKKKVKRDAFLSRTAVKDNETKKRERRQECYLLTSTGKRRGVFFLLLLKRNRWVSS